MEVYAPAIVFLILGTVVGVTFAVINGKLGPRNPQRRDVDPYECGMPSDGSTGPRFGISFYLVAILFLIFDVELILLYPGSMVLEAFGLHALVAIGIFFFLLGVAFLYEWRRGSLDWK